MKALAIALTLLCVVLMFFVRREYKLAILFVASMLLSPLILPFKGVTAKTAISLGFLLSEAGSIGIHFRRIRKSVMFAYLLLALASFILCVITSPHLRSASEIGFFGLTELLTRSLAIVYGFIALRNSKSLAPLLNATFIPLIIMTIVGLINYFAGSSFYVKALLDEASDFSDMTRFRVQSTFNLPFDYGYMCLLVALIHVYGYMKRMESLPVMAVAQVCCLFGVLICNCRTVHFCYLICALVYFVAIQRSRKVKLLVLAGAFLIGAFAVATVPFARKMFLSLVSMFDPDAIIDGSTFTMRLRQLATVAKYLAESPVFGMGVHFFEQDLGWAEGANLAVDYDLAGLEGIHLSLLLERGIAGFALFMAMMLLIVIFIIRKRRLGRLLYAFGLSAWVVYMLFSFMTGELLSAVPTYYILGYVVANLNLRDRYLKAKRKMLHAKS